MSQRERILITGSGGHAKTIVDTLERLGTYDLAGFVGPGDVDTVIYRGYRLLGHDADLPALYDQGIRAAAIGIGFMGQSMVRNRLYAQMEHIGYHLPVLADPTAVVATDVVLGAGTYIGRQAVVNAEAVLGRACIINTGSIVEHECRIGDFSHVAVGAVLCGQVKVGRECLIGANATIIQGLSIGDGSIVGAGAVVTKDIETHVLMRNKLMVKKKYFDINTNVESGGVTGQLDCVCSLTLDGEVTSMQEVA